MLKTLIMLPENTAVKKYKFVCRISSLILKENKSLRAFVLNDFKEFIRSSYILVIKAIVPPETPGITFAIPIPIPLRNSIK